MIEPVTRSEMLLSGVPLEPITRKEMFLAKAAGMDVQTPEPITRMEMFLSNVQQDGGSDPVLQPLTVTENGTYEAPDGVDGYNPVTVNVPVTTYATEEWVFTMEDGSTVTKEAKVVE
jgi:hypothetical protein